MYKAQWDFNLFLEKPAGGDAVADLAEKEKEQTRNEWTPTKPREGGSALGSTVT